MKRFARTTLLSALLATLLSPAALSPALRAQPVDSVRAGIKPPISPRRAFLYSFLIPGAGQAKLDRAQAGGMFFLVEVAALTLVHRSAEDLRVARSFSGDSIPLRFETDPVSGLPVLDANGAPTVAAWSQPRYDRDYVRTRRLHYEDWLAVLFFNHLFAGADAFVAAQLWDLPTKVSFQPTATGATVTASIRFR